MFTSQTLMRQQRMIGSLIRENRRLRQRLESLKGENRLLRMQVINAQKKEEREATDRM